MTTGLDGSIYVGGQTLSTTLDGQPNNGVYDCFLAKYSADGKKLWTKVFGGNQIDSILAMTTGLDGFIYVGGTTRTHLESNNENNINGYISKYSPDGDVIWSRFIEGTSDDRYDGIDAMTTGLDGSIYIGATTSSVTLDGQTNAGLAGTYDVVLAKYTPDGEKLWTKLIGGSANESILTIITGLDGSIYVGGHTSSTTLNGQANADTTGSTSDGFVAKYSAEGTKLWTKLIGGTGNEFIYVMTTGLDGSIFIGAITSSVTLDGQTNAGLAGTYDVVLAKYTPDGEKLWTKLIGGSGDEYIRIIITGLDGSIFIAGSTLSITLDGQYNADPTGITRDGFLAKYSATSRPFRFRFPSKMEFSTKEARNFRAYESGRISYEPASIYWRISPKLPEGLKFNTRNGKISGTPTTVFGELSFTVIAYSSVYTTDRHRIKIRCIE